jgi:hypothetical protein
VLVPFSFTASSPDQTDFDLVTEPASIALLSINGVMQNEEAGDFSVSGSVITLDEGVDVGDTIFGVYAAQYSPIISNFYDVAEEGQTVFTLAESPLAVYSVSVNGIQKNGLAGDYTLVGATLTFAVGLIAGDKVAVVYQK